MHKGYRVITTHILGNTEEIVATRNFVKLIDMSDYLISGVTFYRDKLRFGESHWHECYSIEVSGSAREIIDICKNSQDEIEVRSY